jgi:hypothetical protein
VNPIHAHRVGEISDLAKRVFMMWSGQSPIGRPKNHSGNLPDNPRRNIIEAVAMKLDARISPCRRWASDPADC